MFVKIENYFIDGNADFKGLDPMQVKAGTQIYIDNDAYFFYKGEVVKHDEIISITETEYQEKKGYVNNLPTPKSEIEILQEELEEIKTQNAQMLLALVINDLI